MTAAHFFVPVYFDTESFVILRENVLKALPAEYEAIFHVLDDSAGLDPGVKTLESVRVHQMPRNLGHQRALLKGLRDFLAKERGDFLIVTIDADGEDRPEDLPALLAAYESAKSENPVVLARRTRREEAPFFKFCYFFYKILFRTLTGTLIRSGNFAIYSSSRARELLPHPYFTHAYASALIALGAPLVHVPCPRGSRYRGSSKMGLSRLALHGLRMLLPFRRRVIARAGVFLLVASLLVAVFLALRAPVRNDPLAKRLSMTESDVVEWLRKF